MVCLLMVLPAPAERHAAVQRFPAGAVSLIQRNGSWHSSGELPRVHVVGVADAPCRLPFNFIIVGFGIFFNPAPLEQVYNSLQVLDISYTYPQQKWLPAVGYTYLFKQNYPWLWNFLFLADFCRHDPPPLAAVKRPPWRAGVLRKPANKCQAPKWRFGGRFSKETWHMKILQ